MNSFAESFLETSGRLNHGMKTRFLKYTAKNKWDVLYPFNKIGNNFETTENVSKSMYECRVTLYYSLQLDVMNNCTMAETRAI